MPATTSSPCALTRYSPYSDGSPVDGSRVKQTPVAELVALVAEDHLHDVHRGADVVGDAVRPPVHVRARVLPRLEHGDHCAAQLLARVLRELVRRLLQIDLLERLDELREIVGGEIDVLLHAALALEIAERLLEAMSVDAVDDLAVHLDEPPVRVACEACVSGRAREALDRDVVETEVEDRVHHPRHRDRGARAYGDEQRVAVVAEALPGLLLESRDVLRDLLVEPVGQAALAHVRPAGVGRDREPGGNRHAELRHLRQADPLAAEQLAAAFRGLVECVDVPGHRRE